MIRMPPRFTFKGDKNKATSLKSRALQFYNFVASQAESGGVDKIDRTLKLPDGSFITVSSYKENNYSIRRGNITIICNPEPIIKARKLVFVCWQDGGTRKILKNGTTQLIPNYTSEVNTGFTKYWMNSKRDVALSYGTDGICFEGDKYTITPSSPFISDFSAIYVGRNLFVIYQQQDIGSGPYKYIVKKATLKKPTLSSSGELLLGETIHEFNDTGIIYAVPASDSLIWTISRNGSNTALPNQVNKECYIKCYRIHKSTLPPYDFIVTHLNSLTIDCEYNQKVLPLVETIEWIPSDIAPTPILTDLTGATFTPGIQPIVNIRKNKKKGITSYINKNEIVDVAIKDTKLVVSYSTKTGESECNYSNNDLFLYRHMTNSTWHPPKEGWVKTTVLGPPEGGHFVSQTLDSYKGSYSNSCTVIEYSLISGVITPSIIYNKIYTDIFNTPNTGSLWSEDPWYTVLDDLWGDFILEPIPKLPDTSWSYDTERTYCLEPYSPTIGLRKSRFTFSYNSQYGRTSRVSNITHNLKVDVNLITDLPSITQNDTSVKTPYLGWMYLWNDFPRQNQSAIISSGNSNSSNIYTKITQGYLTASNSEITAIQLPTLLQENGPFTSITSKWTQFIFFNNTLVFRDGPNTFQKQAVTLGKEKL